MQEGVECSARPAWKVLVSRAAHRQTITYGGLAAPIGDFPGAERSMGRVLNPLFHYCTA